MSTGRVVVMDKHRRIQGATLRMGSKNFPVFKGVNTVGRNKTAIIDIKNLSVSQYQAIFVIVDDQQHFVSDLGSSNGTFLHDTQLVPFKLYELTNEALLKFGTIVAKYIKPTNNDVTINLDSESMDITQNMTQGFYAADTQLYSDQTMRRSNITSQDKHTLDTQSIDIKLKHAAPGDATTDIHTVETQPADYPFQPPLAPIGKKVRNDEKETIDECITLTDESAIPLKEPSEECDKKKCVSANEETLTQVDDYSLKPLKDHDEYLKKLNDRDDYEKNIAPATGFEDNIIGECFEDPYYHNNTNMDFSLPDEATATEGDNRNNASTVDDGGYDQNYHDAPRQLDEQPLKNIVPECKEKADDDSEATQIESAENNKEMVPPKKLIVNPPVLEGLEEDSFVANSKSSSNTVIDDSMADSCAIIENMDEASNESPDLLTMPFSIDSTEMIAASDLKPRDVQETKLNIVQNKPLTRISADSETDIDSSEEIVIKRRQCRKLDSESLSNLRLEKAASETEVVNINENRKTIIDSDAETDIEEECGKPSPKNKTDNNDSVLSETQDIKPVAKSRKPLFGSDSDTDDEKDRLDAKKKEETDSETDIEEEFGKATSNENKGKNSNSEPDSGKQPIPNKESPNLNDTDCIPATQDAFAKEFSYKGNDQNHSSEESFKLGLTELMIVEDFNVENQIDNVNHPENIVKDRSLSKENVEESGKSEDVAHPDENNVNNKEKTHVGPSNEKTIVVNNEEQTEQSKEKIGTDKLEDAVDKEEICEDDYMMPTQKVELQSDINLTHNKNNEETNDDYYLMPTQEIQTKSPFKIPNKKYTFKNKKVLLDNTMSTLLNVIKQDDMYIAPTQMMGESEDVYMQATQSIPSQNSTGSKTTSNTDDDDVYCQATQQINNCNTTQEDDVYLLATQPIQEFNDLKQASSSNIGKSQDLYDVPTQVINSEPTSDSQSEMQTYNKNKPCGDESSRPKNPLAQVWEENLQQDVTKINSKRSNTDSFASPRQKRVKRTDIDLLKKKIEEEDSETLSQIEAFVKKPIDEIKQKPNETSKRNLALRKPKRPASEDVETLSQIEAFVNKPMDPKPAIQMNNSTENCTVPKKRSRRVIKDQLDLEVPEDSNCETGDISKDVSLEKDETFSNLSREQEVKSEVDLSFAILASKVNKTKKTITKTNKLCEIKVSEVKRSSMDIAEASRIKDFEMSLQTRKSRRFTTNNNMSMRTAEISKASSKKKKTPESKPQPVNQSSLECGNTSEKNVDDESSKVIENSKPSSRGNRVRKTRGIKTVNEAKESNSNKVIRGKSKEDEIGTQINERNEENVKTNVSPELRCDIVNESEIHVRNSRKKNKETNQEVEIVDKELIPEKTKANVTGTAPRSSKRSVKPILKDEQAGIVSSRKIHVKDKQTEQNSSSVNDTTLISPGRSKDTPKRKQQPKVVFTMMDDPQLESYIKQIGGSVVDSIEKATVLVTQCVKRSQKLLAAVGQGKPICSPEWIVSSKKSNAFLDPWNFILIDEEAEGKWNFSLKESLERASKKALLKDYTFHLMVSKAVDVLKSAIDACGGKCVLKMTKKPPEGKFVIVASSDQKSKYSKIIKQNPEIQVVEPEAIFDGVLRQELRLSKHLLQA